MIIRIAKVLAIPPGNVESAARKIAVAMQKGFDIQVLSDDADGKRAWKLAEKLLEETRQ